MTPWKRLALVVAILSACVGCDQKTKYLAGEHLRGRDGVSLFAGTVRLDYAENEGGFLSLGASIRAPWRAAVFIIGCSAAVAAILSYTLFAVRTWFQIVALSLICAGGIGNLIDRWVYGYTRDFLNVGLGPIRTGIFNVADVALMAGCLLVVLAQRTRTT